MTPLSPEGQRLTAARAELDKALTAAKEAAIRDIHAGISELAAAQHHGLNRTTLRAALGKPTTKKA